MIHCSFKLNKVTNNNMTIHLVTGSFLLPCGPTCTLRITGIWVSLIKELLVVLWLCLWTRITRFELLQHKILIFDVNVVGIHFSGEEECCCVLILWVWTFSGDVYERDKVLIWWSTTFALQIFQYFVKHRLQYKDIYNILVNIQAIGTV